MSFLSSVVLPPLSAIYGGLARARLASYRAGLLPVHKLDAPVISVGNITTGGTGKTPLVEWICRALANDGKKVCVLTRGYGRANPKERVVVSNGVEILAGVREAGDEPFLLAQKLEGLAAVISDADRIASGTWAQRELGSEAFVLDDGFQHLRIARDLDIVVIDATNPWGGGHLLPLGRLREPRRGLSRADCIVVTRSELASDPSALVREIREVSDCPAFISRMQSRDFTSLTGQLSSGKSMKGPFGAFCAVGNPESFFTHLRRQGLELGLKRAFPDHHVYKQSDIDTISLESKKAGARSLVTTEKDAVKLRGLRFSLPCHVLQIDISIDEEPQLLDLIRTATA